MIRLYSGRPFALGARGTELPSSFAMDFVLEGVRHQFGFSVDNTQVTEEWLYYYPEGRQRRLYERAERRRVEQQDAVQVFIAGEVVEIVVLPETDAV